MFKIKIQWDVIEVLKEVKKEIINNGWEFSNWNIKIKWVEVNYDINWQIVEIEIIDKPWLVSESYIEEKIREYFN